MDHFLYRNGSLHAEDVPLSDIAASVGTPFYCYSAATLTRHYQLFKEALAPMDNLVCFAIKSLSNVAVLKLLGDLGAGWMLRSRAAYAPAIRAAADAGDQALNLSTFDLAVLAAIAYQQPISRDGLKEIFGKDISRDLIGRLAERDLIGTGPREPRRGAPYTFVTTDGFLAAFGLETLLDLTDQEQWAESGLGK